MTSYTTIAGRATAEIEEKKSRFIASLAHVETEDEALAFLEEIRAANRMARHNVYAYVLREGGAVAASLSYSPWGEEELATESLPGYGDRFERPHYGYNAEQSSPEGGLQYLRARWYDPSMGAFGSRDSLLGDAADPATLNRYAYAEGNPVASCDPTGHESRVKYGGANAKRIRRLASNPRRGVGASTGTWMSRNYTQKALSSKKPGLLTTRRDRDRQMELFCTTAEYFGSPGKRSLVSDPHTTLDIVGTLDPTPCPTEPMPLPIGIEGDYENMAISAIGRAPALRGRSSQGREAREEHREGSVGSHRRVRCSAEVWEGRRVRKYLRAIWKRLT